MILNGDYVSILAVRSMTFCVEVQPKIEKTAVPIAKTKGIFS
ncbi:hypothetical protein AO385_1597 [Moraxella catarrhalis]|uniref:Uncharacterized protein n=1 Tax=Moraxella catarrhalis TaxID=480 RepID=A0A198UEZ0_MORCA|nr:hypothetical protein AO384_1722 [Moraxella catarrhalis]OAU98575.1 hypothetical protein AO385_1597 [Moraxella catarrhalis]OAU98731.1 hypothetical protein AO383_0453 [Moraxella catarrhalis]